MPAFFCLKKRGMDVKKIVLLIALLFSSKLFAASYPDNTDCGTAGDHLWNLGKDRGRTSNLTPIGPVIGNYPEGPGSSDAGITTNYRDSVWEFDSNLCNPMLFVEDHFEAGQPIGAHGTFMRYFTGVGIMQFGGFQDRGFTFDPAGATSQDQLVETNPWPGASLNEGNNYAGMTLIDCGWTTYWHYGTPPNVNLSAEGARCSDYASWDHLGLTGVLGFTKISGDLLLHMSDQSSTGLAIYDIRDRAQPRILSNYNPVIPQPGVPSIGAGGYWVDTWGERYVVYAAEPVDEGGVTAQRLESAITVVDYLDPENPVLVCYITFDFGTRTPVGSRAMYVAFQDNYAYVDQFRIDLPGCISRFNYDNATDTITDPIDDTDYAAVVTEFPDFVNRADGSQYARPVGQIVILGGIDNGETEQIITLDSVAGISSRSLAVRQSDSANLFLHHVIGGTNDVVVGSLGSSLPVVGDVLNVGGTDYTVTAAVVDERVNEQGMAAFVQWDDPDTTAPFVSGHRPLDGATNIYTDGWVHFQIPSSLRSETIETALNAVLPQDGISVTYNAGANRVPANQIDLQYSHTGNFVLDFDMLVDTTYTVYIAGVQDFMGNLMTPYSFSFTTGNAPITRGTSVFDSSSTAAPSFTGTPYYPNKSSMLACQPGTDNGQVWTVNPHNDTVAVIDRSISAAPDFTLTNTLLANISVSGAERPSSVTEIGTEMAVTYRDSGQVILFDTATRAETHRYNFGHGSQPISSVADGNNLYVALYGDEQIIKINNAARTGLSTDLFTDPQRLVGGRTVLTAEAIGLTGNEIIPATPKAMALSADGSRLLIPRRVSSKDKGLLYDINTSDMTLTRTIDINKVLVADNLDHGSGILNNLNSIVISQDGTRALITAFKQNIDRGALLSGTNLDDDNTIRSALIEIDLVNNIDLNTDPTTALGTVDFDNSADPIAVTFAPDGNVRLVALRGNNLLNAAQTTGNAVASFAAGGAPSEICTTLRTAYVKNLTTGDVSGIDIAGFMFDQRINPPTVTTSTIQNETRSAEELAGFQLFYESRVPLMGAEGYMTCSSCHFDTGHDGQTYDFTQFGEGLRNTLSLNGEGGTRFSNVHWTGNFDQIQDFACQIIQLNGGIVPGISCPAGTDPLAVDFTGLNTDIDNLATYIESLGKDELRYSPAKRADGNLTASAAAGRQLFNDLGCIACHTANIANPENAFTDGLAHDVGTGGSFITPKLTGLSNSAPYFHDGSAITVDAVFDVGQHQTDTASLSAFQKGDLISFVKSIDRDDFIADPVVVSSTAISASKYHTFGHSLFTHNFNETPRFFDSGVYTRAGTWMGLLAQASGTEAIGSNTDGQFTDHNGWDWTAAANVTVTGSYNPFNTSDFLGDFSNQDYTHFYIMPSNFFESHMGGPAPYTGRAVTTAVTEASTLLDNINTYYPSAQKIIYAHWPETAYYLNNENMSRATFTTYNQDTYGSYLDWFINFQDGLVAGGYNDVCMIPVGPIIAYLFENESYLSSFNYSDWYADGAGHGSENVMFLAALVSYNAKYGQSPDIANFTFPAAATQIRPEIINNSVAINDAIVSRLQFHSSNGVVPCR